MKNKELQGIINNIRRGGLSNGSALGHHSGINDEIADLLEKQIPKKPILYSSKKKEFKEGDYIHVDCPHCKEEIFCCFHYPPWNEAQKSHKHCQNCGQAIDWSGEDER